MNEKLIIVRSAAGRQNAKQAVVRVSDKAYYELCVAAADTGRSIAYIADAAIRFALDRMEVVEEDDIV